MGMKSEKKFGRRAMLLVCFIRSTWLLFSGLLLAVARSSVFGVAFACLSDFAWPWQSSFPLIDLYGLLRCHCRSICHLSHAFFRPALIFDTMAACRHFDWLDVDGTFSNAGSMAVACFCYVVMPLWMKVLLRLGMRGQQLSRRGKYPKR